MNEIERIMHFSDAFGPSGFEDDVIAIARQECASICEFKEDHMRNLYMELKQNDKKGVHIMLDAHADEVGFIVQAIKPNGTIRFLPLGGWDIKNIIANKVWIKNIEGKRIPGIVCSKPVHFLKAEEKGKSIGFEDALIDVGACNAQEAIEAFGIRIGAPIIPAVTCSYNMEHATFIGKAFDCRIGCASVVETLKRLSNKQNANTISATLTSQEEVGERGMICAMQNVRPDIVICFEGCPADDTFEEPYMIQSALKKGPMLRHFDVSMITNPRFQRYALHTAKNHRIPVQESVRKGGGTNGGITHTSHYGVPTIVIGVPVRYAHSPYGIIALQDYQHAVALAEKIIEEIRIEDINSF